MALVSHGGLDKAAAVALAQAPSHSGSQNFLLGLRDLLLIVGYQLVIRLMFLARRWNY